MCLVKEFVKWDYVVVFGLVMGIDSVVYRVVLEVGGIIIGVIGMLFGEYYLKEIDYCKIIL